MFLFLHAPINNYNTLSFFLPTHTRKRKRELLEEEEDLTEEDFAKAKQQDSGLPGLLMLPEDDTGLFAYFGFGCLIKWIFWTNHSLKACYPIPPACPSSFLSDPTIAVEADGAEGARKALKTMTWPLMDEDAHASSYITKVLTCLSKWRVKMQTLIESFQADDENPENAKQNLY